MKRLTFAFFVVILFFAVFQLNVSAQTDRVAETKKALEKIKEFNPHLGPNFNLIYPGDKVSLPGRDHRVKKGETLWGIAEGLVVAENRKPRKRRKVRRAAIQLPQVPEAHLSEMDRPKDKRGAPGLVWFLRFFAFSIVIGFIFSMKEKKHQRPAEVPTIGRMDLTKFLRDHGPLAERGVGNPWNIYDSINQQISYFDEFEKGRADADSARWVFIRGLVEIHLYDEKDHLKDKRVVHLSEWTLAVMSKVVTGGIDKHEEEQGRIILLRSHMNRVVPKEGARIEKGESLTPRLAAISW